MPVQEPSHLLVPIDLSEASRAGLRVAAALAQRFGARITALHVESATAGLGALATTGHGAEVAALGKRHLEGVRDRVAEFVRTTVDAGSQVTPVVVEAVFVAEAITEFAKEPGADWICISAAGEQGWRRFFLGSVTAEVIRRSAVPVLTYRAPDGHAKEHGDFQRVLVAVDLGEESRRLVETARALAGAGGEVTILHVIDVAPEYGLYGVPLAIPAENLDAAKEWTEAALERLAKGVDPKTLKVLAGRPSERILAAEKEILPHVTVVGTHGRHGLDRLMLGSVAERVVSRALGPVLVVPTRSAKG